MANQNDQDIRKDEETKARCFFCEQEGRLSGKVWPPPVSSGMLGKIQTHR
jgi:hypothetical protein